MKIVECKPGDIAELTRRVRRERRSIERDRYRAVLVALGGAEEVAVEASVRPLYLPPYSLDFSPIDRMWSKVKRMLRSISARMVESLNEVVTMALQRSPIVTARASSAAAATRCANNENAVIKIYGARSRCSD